MPPIFPAITKSGGQGFAFPDVCKTPAPPAPFAPIPYPNIAMCNQSKKTSTKVKFAGKEVMNMGSQVSRSSGDEAGTLKGLVSATNMDKVAPKGGSANVKVQGKKVVRLTSPTSHNGSNSNMPAGCIIAPGQTKVIVT